MFTFLKYATWCLTPLALAFAALACAAAGACRRKAFIVAGGYGLAFGALLFMSLPVTTLFLGDPLEARFPPIAIRDLPKADAIVVLGGGTGECREPLKHPELSSAGDRAVHAVRLYKAGRAPVVVASGTGVEKSDAQLLKELGLPKEAVLCEGKSRNTAENATFTLELLRKRGAKSMLLVTSAWHMPRAYPQFANQGITVTPAATDYEATLFKERLPDAALWSLLPNADALARNCLYLKEYLGLAALSLRKTPKAPAK